MINGISTRGLMTVFHFCCSVEKTAIDRLQGDEIHGGEELKFFEAAW